MRIKAIILSAVFVACTAIAAMAQPAPATPYASVRMNIGAFYQNDKARDKNCGDTNIQESLSTVSRVGVDFNKGALGGKVEFGYKAEKANGDDIYLRHAFLTYKTSFGLGILAGQTDVACIFPPAQDGWDDSLVTGGYGASNMGRIPQIKFSFNGAYLALIRPILVDGCNVYMPRTNIGYDFKSQAFDLGLGAIGYRTWAKDDAAKANNGDDEFAWMAYLHGTVKLNPAFINFNASYQHAPSLLGMVNQAPAGKTCSALAKKALGYEEVDDNIFEGYVEVGANLTPADRASLIFGYATDLDKTDLTRMVVEATYTRTVCPGFLVVPTLAWVDEGKDLTGEKKGQSIELNVKLQANL